MDTAIVPDVLEDVILSDAEMNSLAAKIVKAEIVGNKVLLTV